MAVDLRIERIESGPVRGPGAPMRRKDREAPEFSIEGDAERPDRGRHGEDAEQGARSDRDEDTPISPKLDDEAGGRLDVTA